MAGHGLVASLKPLAKTPSNHPAQNRLPNILHALFISAQVMVPDGQFPDAGSGGTENRIGQCH